MERHLIRKVSPNLFVSNIRAAHRYCVEKLGFVSPMLWGEPPSFGIPQREGVQFMLRQATEPGQVRPNSAVIEDTWDLYFDVSDARALLAEYSAK